MLEKLDLTDKNSWNLENAFLIASLLRYAHDELFDSVLEEFANDVIPKAIMTTMLSSLFINKLNQQGCTKL